MGSVNFIIIGNLDMERIFCDKEICQKCGGRCCKNSGCVFSPEDFYVLRNYFSDEDRYKYLKNFLKRGYASIGFKSLNLSKQSIFGAVPVPVFVPLEFLLEGEGSFYIRMRNKGDPIVDVNRSSAETNGCVLLGEKGCKLPYSKRPKGGRELIPNILQECQVAYPEIVAAIEWQPYQRILHKLYLDFK